MEGQAEKAILGTTISDLIILLKFDAHEPFQVSYK